MTLLALGINHNTAPIEIRERVAFSPDQMAAALGAACQQLNIAEIAILSTCNRTEIYVWGDVGEVAILRWLADFHQLTLAELEPYRYLHQDEAAIQHMMQVAAGLDSLVLGEPQILGQMKSAYAVANAASTVGRGLHYGFQQVFNC